MRISECVLSGLERVLPGIGFKVETITRSFAEVPYMHRWKLAEWQGRRVFLHRFFRSDADTLHDHPWGFTSVILSGGYYEHTPGRGWENGSGPLRIRWYGPGRVLTRPANWIHRVVLAPGVEAWTLVITGVKERGWGFHCPGIGFTPWRKHLAHAEATQGEGCPGVAL